VEIAFLNNIDFLSENIKSMKESNIEKDVILKNICFYIGEASALYPITKYNNQKLFNVFQELNTAFINNNSEFFFKNDYTDKLVFHLGNIRSDPTNDAYLVDFLKFLQEINIERNTK